MTALLDIPIPDIGGACSPLAAGPGQLCVFLPGDVVICATSGYEIGDPADIVQSFFGSLNSALAPLSPFFDILDVLKALFDCIKAIPDCLGPPPSPTPIVNCLEGLAAAIEKILALVPPFPLFKLLKSIFAVLVFGLMGFRQRLAAIIQHTLDIAAAATKAALLGNVALQSVVDCATGNAQVWLDNLNAGMAPLNRLIGLVNVLLGLAGLPCIPTLDSAAATEAALAPLDAAIAALEAVEAAIPGDITFDPVPPADAPC